MLHTEDQYLDRTFLQDVLTHSCDDTFLRIYADWLMDHDDVSTRSRGEYLRLVYLAEACKDQEQLRDLKWQMHDIWWHHVESWLGPLYDACDSFLYDRGRLYIEVSESLFCQFSQEEIQACPAWNWVTDVVIQDGSVDFCCHLGEMERPPLLQSFSASPGTFEYDELTGLLRSGFWPAIPELNLKRNAIGDNDITSLAYWPGIQGVKELDLEECWIYNSGILSLIQSPLLSDIQVLRLSNRRFDRRLLQYLQDRFGDLLKMS